MAPRKPQRRQPRDYFYGEVLRLPPGTVRPDHYALLGVPYFEPDHDTILRAALERLRLLEACVLDPRPAYRAAAESLLSEVRHAQLTLLDPERRRAYDASLLGTSPDADARTEDDRDVDLPAGRMLQDRYRVIREVRPGGFGRVYEALDRNLRFRVHLTVLRPRLSKDREARRAVERAARTAASVDHPGLLRVDEVGDTEGLLLARTRPVEGRNLLEVIEATPRMRLDPAEARRIAREIAAILQHAHAQGAVHGDLRPHNVFVDDQGRVVVADLAVSRAVADAAGSAGGPFREPENELSPQADLFALGCLTFQMLAGMPPFAAGGPKDEVRPLPDDVPRGLADAVGRLLHPDPAHRPKDAAGAAELLRPGRSRRRLLLAVAAAVLLVAAVVALATGGKGRSDAPAAESLQSRAWRLIAEERYDEAVMRLRDAGAAGGLESALRAPLARALEGAADRRLGEGDPWQAQALLDEALAVEATPERQAIRERARSAAVARLEAVAVAADACTASPEVRLEADDVPLRAVSVGGVDVEPAPRMRVPLELADGAHEIPFLLEDRAGNRREGTVPCTVDTRPPALVILEPEEGARLADGSVAVRVSVDEANPAEVRVGDRPVEIREGVAAAVLRLDDGEHLVEVFARDRAGHESRASRRILVESRAPALRVDAPRVATRDGAARLSGRVGLPVAALSVDGREVAPDDEGRFAADLPPGPSRSVAVEAVGVTGLRRRLAVAVVRDATPPALAARHDRRAEDGTILFGARELEAGTVPVRIEAEDETGVVFLPEEGAVEDGLWRIPAVEGKRTVRLRARDEAGNESGLDLVLEGRREGPRLAVKCSVADVTTDEETVLDVDADAPLRVQGRPAKPGRIRVPLPEGGVTLDVEAEDTWGNVARWSRAIRVDRTAPRVELEGGLERGVGRQDLVFLADEEIASLTCFGRTIEVGGAVARMEADLRPGRRRIHVVARDAAGNVGKASFDLEVKNRVCVLDGKSALRVDLPADLALREWTLECWVRGSPPDRSSVVAGNYDQTDFAIVWAGSNEPLPYGVLFDDRDGRRTMQARKAWKWEQWTHLALSCDGSRARFYVDGSLQGTVDVGGGLRRGRAPLYVGAGVGPRGEPVDFFRGAVDELRLSDVARYTRAFTPARYLKEDERTVLLLRFDAPRDGAVRDHGARALPVKPVGQVLFAEEER